MFSKMKGLLLALVIGGRSKVKFTFYFIFGNIKSCAFKDTCTFYPRIYLLNIFYRSIFLDCRSITYNLRTIYEDGDRSWYDREVATMVINLANLEEKPEIFSGIRSLEQSSSLLYFFPNISPDYIVR